MRSICGVVSSLLALVCSVCAATIDVSTQTYQVLQTGNTLGFTFAATSYANQAGRLGISPYPTQINFAFVSTALIGPGDFTADVESLESSASVSFRGPIVWAAGYASLSEYAGPVSVLDGSLTLSPTDSQSIFDNGYAELVLSYAGDPITVGLSGYTLTHDIFISLGGGPIAGVGGIVYNAYFDPPDASPDTSAPEPGTEWLLCSGMVFCLVALGLERIIRRPLE